MVFIQEEKLLLHVPLKSNKFMNHNPKLYCHVYLDILRNYTYVYSLFHFRVPIV